ncbi:MAG: hypothetical protein Kow0010_15820 [Dehalococcoidia bacterium]
MRASTLHRILAGAALPLALTAAVVLAFSQRSPEARGDERGPGDVVRRLPPPLYRDLPRKDALRFRAVIGSVVVDRGPLQPPAAETVEVGTSLQGRTMDAYLLGSGPRLVVLIGGLHTGEEAETVAVASALLAHYREHPEAIPPEVTLAIIPLANPDGLALGSRVNARGVDLNRNWPTGDWADPAVHGDEVVSAGAAPLSEPETAALYAFLQARRPELVITWHGYASLIEGNDLSAAEMYAKTFAQATGYDYIDRWTLYPITGELLTAMQDLGIPAIDVELARGDVAAVERNLAGVEAVLEQVAADGPTAQSAQHR